MMTAVTIVRVPFDDDHCRYEARAGDTYASGKTAGEALDALSALLPEEDAGTLVIVQRFQPDRFFTAAQMQRLGALMSALHRARDRGEALPSAEAAELESLIEAELIAS